MVSSYVWFSTRNRQWSQYECGTSPTRIETENALAAKPKHLLCWSMAICLIYESTCAMLCDTTQMVAALSIWKCRIINVITSTAGLGPKSYGLVTWIEKWSQCECGSSALRALRPRTLVQFKSKQSRMQRSKQDAKSARHLQRARHLNFKFNIREWC